MLPSTSSLGTWGTGLLSTTAILLQKCPFFSKYFQPYLERFTQDHLKLPGRLLFVEIDRSYTVKSNSSLTRIQL